MKQCSVYISHFLKAEEITILKRISVKYDAMMPELIWLKIEKSGEFL
jgi:hypothetical protein